MGEMAVGMVVSSIQNSWDRASAELASGIHLVDIHREMVSVASDAVACSSLVVAPANKRYCKISKIFKKKNLNQRNFD